MLWNVVAMFSWLLRVPEPFDIVDLRWDQMDFARATLRVPNAKQEKTSAHPISADRASRRDRACEADCWPSCLSDLSNEGRILCVSS